MKLLRLNRLGPEQLQHAGPIVSLGASDSELQADTVQGAAIISFDFGKVAATLIGDRYHCYVDETNDDRSGLCGAGLLVTTAEVPKRVIEQALINLEKDPDRTRPDRVSQDEQTLQRRYFHGSDDSANAHAHLCNSIRENVEGVFIFSLFDAHRIRQERSWAQLNDTDLQNAAWVLGADFTTSGTIPVDFLIEKRAGLGQVGKKWVDAFYRRRDWKRYEMQGAQIPIAYPPMNCRVGPKTVPGLQVTDFLLWAALRSINGQSDWENRVGLTRTYFMASEDSEKAGQYVYSLGERSLDLPLLKYDDATLDAFNLDIAEPLMHWQNQFLAIEWLVCLCAKLQPSSVLHLLPGLHACTQMLTAGDGVDCTPRCIEQLATMYLRLFDTLPAYGPVLGQPKEAVRIFYEARNTAALIIRKDQTASRFWVSRFCKFRRHLKQHEPSRLPYNFLGTDE